MTILRRVELDSTLPRFDPAMDVGSIARPMAVLASNFTSRLADYDLWLPASSSTKRIVPSDNARSGPNLVTEIGQHLGNEVIETDTTGDDKFAVAARAVAEAALSVFMAGPRGCTDFFFVHLLTSTRALESLLPMFALAETGVGSQLQRRAIAAMWKTVVWIYVARGRPSLPNPGQQNASAPAGTVVHDDDTWSDLVRRTIAVDDAHLQKVTMLARGDWRHRGRDPRYIEAVTKAVEFFEAGGNAGNGKWWGEG
jgi:hypothetical protein